MLRYRNYINFLYKLFSFFLWRAFLNCSYVFFRDAFIRIFIRVENSFRETAER